MVGSQGVYADRPCGQIGKLQTRRIDLLVREDDFESGHGIWSIPAGANSVEGEFERHVLPPPLTFHYDMRVLRMLNPFPKEGMSAFHA